MKPSLLSDDLLQSLMAAGQTDILVGLPTQNHAGTAGAVARAVLRAFEGPFVRQRTVLLNLDAGSTDGTPELVRNAASGAGDLVAGGYALRSIHRITAPYHGMPERGRALRVLFTAADLLRAQAVVVLDPTAATTPDDAARWISLVLSKRAEYVKPCYPRRWDEGPLITQLVRPLMAAAYGSELLEPTDTQLACSGAFAVEALTHDFWGVPQADVGIDAFLSAHATSGNYRLMQLATRAHPTARRGLSVSEVFRQVVGAVLACLAHAPSRWLDAGPVQPVPIDALPAAPSDRTTSPSFDIAEYARAFRLGTDALAPLYVSVLEQELFDRVTNASRGAAAVTDELWAEIVFAFAGAALRRELPVDRLAQLLEPIYLGRVASFLTRSSAGGDGAAARALILAFQARKTAFCAASGSQGKAA